MLLKMGVVVAYSLPVKTTLDVVKEVSKNLGLAFAPLRTWRLKQPRAGMVFTGRDEDLERFAFAPTRSLIKILGNVKDLHILEIGPGDYLTSGLSLLAAGATSYTVVDRFPGDHSGATAKEWYVGIQKGWPRFFSSLTWPDFLDASVFPENYAGQIRVISEPIEKLQETRRYDVVCSYQVGEHVSDINAFARLTAQLLSDDGTAVHRVDFGPHGCWESYPDPLTFLRFPDWIWNLMGSHRGAPNRCRHHEMVKAFESAGLDLKIAEIEFFESGLTDRARLNQRFQKITNESLYVKTAVYICRHSVRPKS
jgi:hypothetical protein